MLTIRQATTADIPTIRELASIAFPHTYATILSAPQIAYMMEWMYGADSLMRQMTSEHHTYYLALLDGLPVGYLSIQPEGDDACHLQKLYLLPAYQGMHLGQQMFAHATQAIKALYPTVRTMRLNVNRHNAALHFYQKMGMVKVAEGDFPIGDGYYMNDYIMALPLRE